MQDKYHAITFVYQHRRTHKTRCQYLDEADEKHKTQLNGWLHVATINPAVWLETLLNAPEAKRLKMIEGLMK